MRIKSGGGIQSRNVSHRYEPKVEPVAHKANVGAVAQEGRAVQFEKEPLTQGRGYEPKPMGPTGIGRATTSTATSGPGSQRTTYASGSQGRYGPNAPNAVNRSPDPPGTAPGRDILSDYGPEIRKGR
jgi:hypothetical protein